MGSQAHTTQNDIVSSEVTASTNECVLCSKLEGLKSFAEKKYASYRGVAERSDNKREVFDPLATNFLHASELLVQAVLRSTQREMEQTA